MEAALADVVCGKYNICTGSRMIYRNPAVYGWYLSSNIKIYTPGRDMARTEIDSRRIEQRKSKKAEE